MPSGLAAIYLGVDDSVISGNRIENNDFGGVAIVDYCAVVTLTPFNCAIDPSVTPEFEADSIASNNRVFENTLINNAGAPAGDFAFAAADLGLLTDGDHGNCYEDNIFTSFFSLIGFLPPCEPAQPEP